MGNMTTHMGITSRTELESPSETVKKRYYQKFKEFKKAKDIFDSRLDEFKKQYNNKFVAVITETNIEIDESRESLVKRIYEKYGNVTMFLDKITPDYKPKKMPNHLF